MTGYTFQMDSVWKRCLKWSKDQKLPRHAAEWEKGQGAPGGRRQPLQPCCHGQGTAAKCQSELEAERREGSPEGAGGGDQTQPGDREQGDSPGELCLLGGCTVSERSQGAE